MQLSRDNWQNVLQQQQKQLIQNVYNKRLSAQLSDTVAASVIKEANNQRLKHYFTHTDFQFFDAQGNFIGENLKVLRKSYTKSETLLLMVLPLKKNWRFLQPDTLMVQSFR